MRKERFLKTAVRIGGAFVMAWLNTGCDMQILANQRLDAATSQPNPTQAGKLPTPTRSPYVAPPTLEPPPATKTPEPSPTEIPSFREYSGPILAVVVNPDVLEWTEAGWNVLDINNPDNRQEPPSLSELPNLAKDCILRPNIEPADNHWGICESQNGDPVRVPESGGDVIIVVPQSESGEFNLEDQEHIWPPPYKIEQNGEV